MRVSSIVLLLYYVIELEDMPFSSCISTGGTVAGMKSSAERGTL